MSNRLAVALRRWVDSSAEGDQPRGDPRGIDWPRVVPFVALHLGCLGAIWTGWSPFAAGLAVALFAVRMFAITAFYHRYFSHRAFRTSRGWQFVFAVLGASAVQRGPLWWAAHHRHHHVHSDRPEDVHSARQEGFLRSHMGWFLARENFATRTRLVRDLARYPELRWLDRYDVAVPAALFVALWALGAWLEAAHPSLGTSAVAARRVGLLHLDRRAVPLDLRHQLAGALLGHATLRDERRLAQQSPARARHLRRGLAQQPPSLPRRRAPGLLLVGTRPELVRPEAARRARHRA